MKRLLMMSFLSVIVTSVFALKKDPVYRDARKNGAMARMQLHIVDDLGCNVSNAAVSVFMGMNFRPQGYYLNGMTDANGKYVAEGKTCGDEIEIDVVKQGHYPSSKRLCYAVMGSEHEVKNGKWQPFGKEETIVLRRMVNPVNLIVFDKVIDVVRTNAWLGFDMESMDFI